ncbi:MAG: tRNA guanosine(34) transglycosylase Tgt [Phycisphaerales bacterium]|nr:tRNA guanosine(34) transglycosylase Tgt [Planctomycetota bacterium]MCH8509567.1 tRNA guanosine(34) transglycosylase Tgt [Phycisphaerales bacterium]
MPAPLRFTIHARSGHARVGTVETPHGSFETPAFMPVGTKGTVKGVLPHLVRATGAQILLNNTYHLMLRPGSELIQRLGGVHRFMNWDGPILTDSGGYQAYSMADINAVDDDGVSFKSIVDGSVIRMTPESAVRIQNELGPDIMMAFDDCPPSVDPAAAPVNQARLRHAARRDAGRKAGYDHAQRLDLANERTVRWLERCRAAHARPDEQALFGIIQGGTDLGRRDWCIERICGIDLPGYAIGGVAVGETSDEIARVVRHTAPKMPQEKPRYLMGVGYERDITAAVLAGVDMFDCVLPTRNARNANAFTAEPGEKGQIRLKNARFAEDPRPLEPGCDCPACDPSAHAWPTRDGLPFSRAYVRHLFQAEEMLGPILVTLHNLRFFQRLTADLRRAIREEDWAGFVARRPHLSDLVAMAWDGGPGPA